MPSVIETPYDKTIPLVVLTGGSGRIDSALQLVSSGHHDKIFISGVNRGVELEALINFARSYSEVLRCCVELGYEATNTRGNAQEVKMWINKNSFKQFRLLTSNYHMPRAIFEMRAQMPSIKIFEYPIASTQIDLKRWWESFSTTWLLFGEYSKNIYTMVFHKIKVQVL